MTVRDRLAKLERVRPEADTAAQRLAFFAFVEPWIKEIAASATNRQDGGADGGRWLSSFKAECMDAARSARL